MASLASEEKTKQGKTKEKKGVIRCVSSGIAGL